MEGIGLGVLPYLWLLSCKLLEVSKGFGHISNELKLFEIEARSSPHSQLSGFGVGVFVPKGSENLVWVRGLG